MRVWARQQRAAELGRLAPDAFRPAGATVATISSTGTTGR
jgi:hypothetical protein